MIPGKAEPRFDLDLQYGHKGEVQVETVLKWVTEGSLQVEVKRKRYLDRYLYIETHCDKRRSGVFEPSGISTTESQVWVFVFGDAGVHVAIPTEYLKHMLSDPSSRDKQERDGSCPTRGKLVDFCVLLYRLQQRGTPQGFPAQAPVMAPMTITDHHRTR